MPYRSFRQRRRAPYRRRRRNYGRKFTNRRKYSPRSRIQYRANAKYQLANKVELIKPITLKPMSQIKKFIYYNTAEVVNTTIADAQNAQFITFNLNSPWLLNDDTYIDQGNNSWNWNTPVQTHADGTTVQSGTSFPGMFDTVSSIGYGYANILIVGAKYTFTATPIFRANQQSGAPTALFSLVQSQSTHITQNTTIDDIYGMPYSQVRLVQGGGTNSGDLSGNAKSASIVLKYSPKRFNKVQSLLDNHQFRATVDSNFYGTKPSDMDRVSFGLVNVMSHPNTANPCVSCMIQVKCEITALFSEPLNNNNTYPGLPANQMDVSPG